TLHHAPSAVGAFWRRMQGRRGTPQAITAPAHKLARLVSHRLAHGSAYMLPGLDAYEAPYRARKVMPMAKQAKALGSTPVPLTAQGSARLPWPRQPCPSSQSASHALPRHGLPEQRGRSVLSTPRPLTLPIHRGSPAVAAPANMPLHLFQKGLTSW